MPKLHAEALLFCLVWAALAVTAAVTVSLGTGMLFSAGLALILMPVSALVVSRTESMEMERQVRWGLLALASLVLVLWLQFA
jgi:predicted phage tail protein